VYSLFVCFSLIFKVPVFHIFFCIASERLVCSSMALSLLFLLSVCFMLSPLHSFPMAKFLLCFFDIASLGSFRVIDKVFFVFYASFRIKAADNIEVGYSLQLLFCILGMFLLLVGTFHWQCS
jgi:hypothetical protein